jgi:hypothetical protein
MISTFTTTQAFIFLKLCISQFPYNGRQLKQTQWPKKTFKIQAIFGLHTIHVTDIFLNACHLM